MRARATPAGALGFALLLSVGSLLLVSTLEDRLTEASDQLSRSRVDDLLRLARSGDLPQTLRNVDDNGVAQVVAADRTVLAASPNLAGDPAIADLHPGRRAATSTFPAPDDSEIETYRFWYASGPSSRGTVTVYVGDSLETVTEASAALRRALWLGVPVVLALLGVVIWLLLGQVIGRLDRIRAEVDRISAANPHARVAGDSVDDEVGRLTSTMNAMLERLDLAAQRQRDFVADVSHDLQSSVAAQRVALEVALTSAIVIGELRHNLLDIRLVVSLSVSWALLSGFAALGYVMLAGVLGSVLAHTASAVTATAVVALAAHQTRAERLRGASWRNVGTDTSKSGDHRAVARSRHPDLRWRREADPCMSWLSRRAYCRRCSNAPVAG